MRATRVVITLAVAACGGTVEPTDEAETSTAAGGGAIGEDRAASACDGRLTAEPRLLASGLGTGSLLLAGDAMIVVDAESGRVTRVDRCSGDVATLAELGSSENAAMHGDDVFVATSGEAPRLERVPLGGGAATTVATLPARTRVASTGASLVVAVDLPSTTPNGPTNLGVNLHLLEGTTLVPIRMVDASIGGTVGLVGASAAGAYIRHAPHCSCNPGLTLVRLDGGADVDIAGTHGARTLALQGDDGLVVASEAESYGMGSGVVDIARVPLAGGAREVLVPSTTGLVSSVRSVAASDAGACWVGEGAPVRCVDARVGEVRDLADGVSVGPITMADDALYWLRASAEDGGGADLWAVALK
jgi:hypothetical protein